MVLSPTMRYRYGPSLKLSVVSQSHKRRLDKLAALLFVRNIAKQ